jgi:hypothetical protein
MNETNTQEVRPEAKLMLDPFGSLFKAAWRTYEELFEVLIGIIAGPALSLVVGISIRHAGVIGALLGALLVVVGIIAFIPASVALVLVIAKKTVGVKESYKRAMPLFWPVLWLGLLVFVVTMGGFFMFIVPGIMLGVWLLFSNFALVLEGKRGMRAMSRSREYVRGYWWPIFGRYLLLSIIIVGVSVVLHVIIADIGGRTIGDIENYLFSFMLAPLQMAFLYELYKNILRVKPAVAEDTSVPTANRGFLIASGIVGIVAPIVIFALVVVASLMLFIFKARSMRSESSFSAYDVATSTALNQGASSSFPGGRP